ncbi:MAG TPA: Fic family protein [Sphingobium sp.]|uniref:Fic family protein n=1 Tax=Sphingobium sp. TaxID=1912891 RepID=UPI002ED6BBE7
MRRLPEPHAAHYGVVPLPPPESSIVLTDALPRLRRANAMIERVDALAAELDDPYWISRLLSRREAVTSSAMEGTNSTLDELLSVEEDDDNARSVAKQVRDYATTLDRFVPQAQEFGNAFFTPELIRALHAEAMRHDPHYLDVPGELRSTVVWIGGGGQIAYSTYNPPPPDDVAASLSEAAQYMRCEGMQPMTQSLVMRMAIAHAHFEAVHPFRDGNGRVGRLLLPLMMAADGHTPLYISPYIEANKAGYYAGLKNAQQQLDWDPLVGYLSDAIIATVDEQFATRRAMRNLREHWHTRRRFRAGSAATRMLEMLPDYPVVTAKRLGERLALSPPAVLTAIGQLEEAGILTERTGYRRNRVFVATEVLSIVNRPVGSEPILDMLLRD